MAPTHQEKDAFKPISVKPPNQGFLLFYLRLIFDLQLYTIVRYLKPALKSFNSQGGAILDIGAGEAPWKSWVPKNCTYTGIDVENAENYGMKPKIGSIQTYDGENIPFPPNFFQGAICIEVLEHVKEPLIIINEIARVLSSESLLYVTVPWSARRHHIPFDYFRYNRETLEIFFSKDFYEIEIFERGNDIAVIASKLIVLHLRTFNQKSIFKLTFSILFSIIILPFTIFFILISHISIILDFGSKQDPLGYFIKARKK